MKLVSTNLLNRFWKNGVVPIKNELAKKLSTSKIINNLLATAAGYALDARQGPVLQGEIDEINSNLNALNTGLEAATSRAQQGLMWNSATLARKSLRIKTPLSLIGSTLPWGVAAGSLENKGLVSDVFALTVNNALTVGLSTRISNFFSNLPNGEFVGFVLQLYDTSGNEVYLRSFIGYVMASGKATAFSTGSDLHFPLAAGNYYVMIYGYRLMRGETFVANPQPDAETLIFYTENNRG